MGKEQMKITILATENCDQRSILEKQLQDAGLQFITKYFEDHPELAEKYQLKQSPLLLVNDKVVTVGMPEQKKIKKVKQKRSTL